MLFRALPPIALLLTVGCGTTSAEPQFRAPTLVAVSPDDFTGDVPCTAAPGAMRRYVVTLFDLGTAEEPITPFALPSSVVRSGSSYRPIACEQAAAFGFVIPGHLYDAEVEAYDRTDLVALGAGSRTLVDSKTGAYVPPRWTTTCGRKTGGSAAEGPALAAFFITRFVRGCEPLTEQGPGSPTAISVEIGAALGELECGSLAGQVDTFEVTRADAPGQVLTAPCGQAVVFDDVEPGVGYSFEVQAYEAGSTGARWGTTCYRSALPGATVTAGCDPLSERGALDVTTQAVLDATGQSCGAGGISRFETVTSGGQTQTANCGNSLRVGELEAGSNALTVSTILDDGSAGPSLICDGFVLPGLIRPASCTLL